MYMIIVCRDNRSFSLLAKEFRRIGLMGCV